MFLSFFISYTRNLTEQLAPSGKLLRVVFYYPHLLSFFFSYFPSVPIPFTYAHTVIKAKFILAPSPLKFQFYLHTYYYYTNQTLSDQTVQRVHGANIFFNKTNRIIYISQYPHKY